MRLNIKERIAGLAKQERALLVAGEKPQPLLKNRIQRTAVRMLAIFLLLMLVFTIISRAADAITIANVQVDAMKSGVLTNRATIEGTIEAAGNISLSFPEGLRVQTVYVKEGQRVNEGDQMLAFDPEELGIKLENIENEINILNLKISAAQSGVSMSNSEDIITAQQALDDAKGAYSRLVEKLDRQNLRSKEDYTDLETALEKAKVNYNKVIANTKAALIKAAEDTVKQAEKDLETTKESADDAIRSAQQAVDSAAESMNASMSAYQQALSAYNQAQNKLTQAKQLVNDLETAASQGEDNTEALAAAREALSVAQSDFDQAAINLNAQSAYGNSAYNSAAENLKVTKQRWEKNIKKAEEALSEAKAKLEKTRQRTDFTEEVAVISAQSAVDSAESALKSAQRGLEDNEYSREEQLYSAEKDIEIAQRNLESAQRQASANSHNNAISQVQAEIDRLTYLNDLDELEDIKRILEEALINDGVITAPMAGTVLKTMEMGEKTPADTDSVTLSRNDESFVFEGSLDQKTAEKFSVGDTGQLAYTYEGKSQKLDLEITSIGVPDGENKVAITVNLPEGSYPAGQSGELSITKKSETNDSCLPLSALRSDASGDHVLVLREKKTVMGSEWTVVRVDISVKDRDSELMSVESTVESPLLYSDKVVVSSNKPISEGDRVRIENE